MQKLYQTFVAQAAQLQSVHENVKVSTNFMKWPIYTQMSQSKNMIDARNYLNFCSDSKNLILHRFLTEHGPLLEPRRTSVLPSISTSAVSILDLEAPVSLLPPGLFGGLDRRLWVQAGVEQEVAEHAARHHRSGPVLERAKCCSGGHGSHTDPATAANSRSDCLQVLECSHQVSEGWKEHRLFHC